ncbi:MAG: 3-phytase precursor [Verrucomicrobiota bacterium]
MNLICRNLPILLVVALAAGCVRSPAPDPLATNPPLVPRVVSEPVPHDADDPAIWINPEDPARSLVLGTDKDSAGGLYAFDLAGRIVARVAPLARPNNVDVLRGVRLGGGAVDVALVTEREAGRLRVFRLPDLAPLDGGGLPVMEGDPSRSPMGVAGYRRARDGTTFVFVGGKDGPADGYLLQYRLEEAAPGRVRATRVRAFGAYSGRKEIEAIAVDTERGWVYYSDEGVGVRKYAADPDAPEGNAELALLGATGFAGDHEGIAIRSGDGTEGAIIVSNQQAWTFRVFAPEGPPGRLHDHRQWGSVRLSTRETDGCEISQAPLPGFPGGLFVAMSDNRTFHYYAWDDLRAALGREVP